METQGDDGFTLVEAMVVVALVGILAAIAISGWDAWSKASAHSGTAREVQAVLQQAHERAVAEGRALCVWFDPTAGTYTVHDGACASKAAVLAGPHRPESPVVRISSPSFAGTGAQGVTMFPRGTTDGGTVLVTRNDSGKVYRLTVERLTGRVFID